MDGGPHPRRQGRHQGKEGALSFIPCPDSRCDAPRREGKKRETMSIPDRVNTWIEEDVQAMIWNKEPVFHPDEDGAIIENKRFMRKGAQFNDKVALGLGLINWKDHVKGIQVKALLDYIGMVAGATTRRY